MSTTDRERASALMRDAAWLRGHDPALGCDLLDHGVIIRRAAGEWIYGEGDPGTGLVMVLEGLVRLHCATAGGLTVLIGQAGPGAMLGQAVRFGGGPRLHTLICAEPSVLMKVSDTAIFEIGERRPEVWRFVAGLLYAQIRGALALATQAIALPARRRVAARLHLMAPAGGEIPLSQADLAEMLGLARKTVNLHLGAFERAGLVRRAYGWVEVLQPAALEAIADAED